MQKLKSNNQDPITRSRQHPIVLMRAILLNVAACIILPGISYAFEIYWFLLFLIVPLATLLWEVAGWRGREYVIFDTCLVRREGPLFKSQMNVTFDSIKDLYHRQSILGKLVGYGHITIGTSEDTKPIIFSFVPNSVNFKHSLDRQRISSRAILAEDPRNVAAEF